MSSCDSGFDVVVVGAGPVGCSAALAQAHAGARVLLLEANPRASERLAGEWLHPRGVRVLRELGIDPAPLAPYPSGRGFALHPEDGSAPILLPYSAGAAGWSGEHAALVELLREAAAAHPAVTYLPHARATQICDGRVVFQRASAPGETAVSAGMILGADGRKSRARAALGLRGEPATLSRMAGVRLLGAELPHEGFGHVFLGGPGPMLAYRIGPDALRLCLDVPIGAASDPRALFEDYAPALPDELRPALERALRDEDVAWALNQARPRRGYGRTGLAILGDAAGFQHPLTAVGMTLGLCDAQTLAASPDSASFARARRRSARVAELLAAALYEVFSQRSATALAMRRSVYALWRRSPAARVRSMRYLAAEDGQLASFALTFLRIASAATAALVGSRALAGDWRGTLAALRELATRAGWLVAGALRGPEPSRQAPVRDKAHAPLARSARPALERGVEALVALQRGDGSWEGEVIWCPMLAAQYVLFAEAIGLEIPAERRAGLLRHFERTRLDSGTWGLHARSAPYLFVTALVYVASRLLGVPAAAPELAGARAFIGREGILAIPSWGKLWLAIVGLYDWRGVPPLIPELWALPRWLPFHPARFYCHTRQIYLAMSSLYARRVSAPDSARLRELRSELYPDGGLERVDWDAARKLLRPSELITPPSAALRAVYRLFAFYERHQRPALRARVLRELDERIRWELRSTDHTSLSPVSGLLNALALHASAPHDPDSLQAIARLDAWMWHDEEDGLRIAGARSASWDTSFALQALAAAGPQAHAEKASERGITFLRAQQIRDSFPGHREAFRLDPRGGFCFASAWHGWPVSDCSAEALDALVASEPRALDASAEQEAVRFVLRCQNPDGGFGSYEARRSRLGLEWLNPAEMFGESMTEHSYVECTGSSLAALAGFRRRHPELDRRELDRALARGERRLRRLQGADGSWRGVWGVQFIYGTLFAVRGLRAAGAPANDPAVLRACAWLHARQRQDGGWGEHHSGCLVGRYVEHDASQLLHTAWALMTLLEAGDSDWESIARGARCLIDAQRPDGSWPRQDPAGLFFRTALLEYELYRSYFPLWALGLYEARRAQQESSSVAGDRSKRSA